MKKRHAVIQALCITPVDQRKYAEVLVEETSALFHSPIACAIADAWVRNQRDVEPQLGRELERIEAATHGSPLRTERR